MPRIAFPNDKLSYNAKKLRWTTTLKKEHLKNTELDNKNLQVPVKSVNLEGSKEKVLIDTGTNASFIVAE